MRRTNGNFTLRDVYVSGSDDHVLAAQRFGATVEGEERSFDVSSVLPFKTAGRVSVGSTSTTRVHTTSSSTASPSRRLNWLHARSVVRNLAAGTAGLSAGGDQTHVHPSLSKR